jgi:uncharacterized protein (DUF488 family)
MSTKLYTIGFTQKSAEEFFEILKENEISTLIDIRLSNQSQLAGFTKGRDLPYFIKEICGAGYLHLPEWAPTKEIMDGFKKKGMAWETFEKQFNALMAERKIEDKASRLDLDRACLLCSEPTPDHCHRRLVAEYLERCLPGLSVMHL